MLHKRKQQEGNTYVLYLPLTGLYYKTGDIPFDEVRSAQEHLHFTSACHQGSPWLLVYTGQHEAVRHYIKGPASKFTTSALKYGTDDDDKFKR